MKRGLEKVFKQNCDLNILTYRGQERSPKIFMLYGVKKCLSILKHDRDPDPPLLNVETASAAKQQLAL